MGYAQVADLVVFHGSALPEPVQWNETTSRAAVCRATSVAGPLQPA
jgi:hypothetical protein